MPHHQHNDAREHADHPGARGPAHEPARQPAKPGGLFARLSRIIWGESVEAPISHKPAGAAASLAADDDTRDATPEELAPAYQDSDTVDAETLAEVNAQLAARKKIEAIKTYRLAAGCDLKTAKQAVERIARENENQGRKAA